LRPRRRTIETIRQSVSVDARRTTADSMVVRVVTSHLVVQLTRGNRVSSSGLAKGEVSCWHARHELFDLPYGRLSGARLTPSPRLTISAVDPNRTLVGPIAISLMKRCQCRDFARSAIPMRPRQDTKIEADQRYRQRRLGQTEIRQDIGKTQSVHLPTSQGRRKRAPSFSRPWRNCLARLR